MTSLSDVDSVVQTYAADQVAPVQSQLDAATANLATVQGQVTALQTQVNTDAATNALLQTQITSDAAANSSLQTQLTAANTAVTNLQAQIATLQAQVIALTPVAVIDYKDFSVNSGGAVVEKLIGNGIAKSTFEIAPNTSTHAATVITTRGSSYRNPYYVLKSKANSSTVEIANLTINATAQGHVYGGLLLDHNLNPYVHDVLLKGIPGTDNEPPGEIFGYNGWGCTNALIQRMEVDGAGVGAAGMGTNLSTNETWEDCYVHDCPYSTATFWQTNTVTTKNLRSINNFFGLNHENVTGKVRHTNLTVAPDPKQTSAPHFHFMSNVGDNADIEIHGVQWANGLTSGRNLTALISDYYHTASGATILNQQVSLPKIYNTAGNLMKWADAGIQARVVNGVAAPRTPSANIAAAQADPQNWVIRYH